MQMASMMAGPGATTVTTELFPREDRNSDFVAEIGRRFSFIVLVGGPGCGKDSIVQELRRRSDLFGQIQSCTTRPKPTCPKRGMVELGKYKYLSKPEFSWREKQGYFAWATGEILEGVRYGTERHDLEQAMRSPWPTLIDVEMDTVPKLHAIIGDKGAYVFIGVKKAERERRLRARDADKPDIYYADRVAAGNEWKRQMHHQRSCGFPWLEIRNEGREVAETVRELIFKLS